MEYVTDEGFIVAGQEVAMPESTAMKLLGVDRDRLAELVRMAGIINREGGALFQAGQYYFLSPEAIFKVRDINGKKTADLSRTELYKIFETAEERLLPREVVSSKRKKLYLKIIVFLFVIIGGFVYVQNNPAEKPQPTPTTVEQPREKPKPKVERPEENFYYESYTAIAEKTGMLVTDSWLLEYGEYVSKTGEVNTHGFVELNGDGVKRQFWLTFDGATRRVVRVKIGPDLIYSESGR